MISLNVSPERNRWPAICCGLVMGLLTGPLAIAEVYRFESFQQEHGLKNLIINSIALAPQGEVWVGTENGLYRFDGRRFEGIDTRDHEAGRIRAVLPHGGRIWFRGKNRIYFWQGGKVQLVSSLPARGTAHSLSPARDGSIYALADNAVLHCLTSGCQPIPLPGPQLANPEAIHVDAAGSIWFTCWDGLCRLDGAQIRRYGPSEGLPGDTYRAVASDSAGRLWIRSLGRLIVREPGSERFEPVPLPFQGISNEPVLAVDRTGRVWVSFNGGLAVLEQGRWKMYTPEQGLPTLRVTALVEDSDGSIWLGSDGTGVHRWAGARHWKSYSLGHGLREQSARAVYRHDTGPIWLGGDHGLYRLSGDQKQFAPVADPQGWLSEGINAVTGAGNGDLWLAMAIDGVVRYQPGPGTVRRYPTPTNMPVRSITGVGISRNTLFASGRNGVFSLDLANPKAQLQRVEGCGAGREDYYSLATLANGELLAVGAQLCLYADGAWQKLDHRLGYRDKTLRTAAVVGADLWVAYREPQGLTRIRNWRSAPKAEHHVAAGGELISDRVSFLGSDGRGNLWAGTDSGIARYDGQRWRTFSTEDGLVWNNANSRAFLAQPDGSIWVGTSHGLSHFQAPATLPPVELPMVVAEASFGHRQLVAGEESTFGYAPQAALQVSFHVLNAAVRNRLAYQFRLDGLDEDWIASPSAEVRYSSLPHGAYRLRFRVKEMGGPWVEYPGKLAFSVAPAWWNRIWFWTLCVAAVAAFAFWFHRRRMSATMKRERQLEQLVDARTKELAIARDQALAAGHAKAAFLANMSHEIRTPMNGVVGMAELLSHTPLNDEQQEYVQTVKESADNLLVVLNDILDYSKIEAGKMSLEHIGFDLPELVESVMRAMRAAAARKRLNLQKSVADNVPRYVAGDPGRLRQVLLNLMSNSVKFTARGGIVVDVSVADEGGILFGVADTGVGVPRELRSRLFQSFEQGDTSTTRRYGGTGLGLAISKQLVQLMGGEIGFEDRAEGGSRFWFRVPLEQVAAPPVDDHEKSGEVPVFQRARVLVAEDNALNRRMMERILTQWGLEVDVAADGREALEVLLRWRYDLVLMDAQMPYLDGYEVTSRLRSAPCDNAQVPIVAVTANALNGDRERCLAAGMNDYVSKPVDLVELRRVVAKWLLEAPRSKKADD